jgi:ComF family protein
MKLINEISDFFLPRNCSACETPLQINQNVICTDCRNKFILPSEELISAEYKRKFLNDSSIKDFCSAFIFEVDKPIQTLVHELKYQKRFGNGIVLGKLTANILEEKIKSWNADFIIPVPLHPIKKAERGFNQAYFIAKGISKVAGIKVKTGVIKRIKFTETQTHLNLIERKQNIRDAFIIKKKKVIKGKSIILIDDVVTTGATINECGKILKENGAANVYALSAAIADYNSTSFQARLNPEL